MTTVLSDPAAVFAAALDRLAAVQRRPDADEPRQGAHTPRYEALSAAAEARQAVERASGPAAVLAHEAAANLRTARTALAAARSAREAGVRVDDLDALIAQEEIAAERAEATSARARVEAERMAARTALEDDHAPELAVLNAHLEQKGRHLSAAAARAEAALIDLYGAAVSYSAAVAETRERLAAAGFTPGGHFDGTPHPTQVAEVLTVGGRRWPAVNPAEAVARSARRIALAAGERGRGLAEALRPRAGRPDAVEPVLPNGPLPRLEAR